MTSRQAPISDGFFMKLGFCIIAISWICDILRRMTRELRIAGPTVPPDVVARVAAATRLETLEDLLRFGFAQHPPWELAEVVVQDEFTHDVIVRGPGPAFLVFDTT